MEIVNQIEDLKESLIPLKERDEELKSVILKLGQSNQNLSNNSTYITRIDTCSHTLKVLVTELQKSLENELKLKSQIADQKNSFYHLKK